MKKEFRVRKNEEFARIISEKRSVSNSSFVVYYSGRKEEHARVGISVSKKLGDAVDRNRIKRQIREMIRALIDFAECPKDLIVIVRKPYLEKAFLENKNDLEKALKKAIIEKYE